MVFRPSQHRADTLVSREHTNVLLEGRRVDIGRLDLEEVGHRVTGVQFVFRIRNKRKQRLLLGCSVVLGDSNFHSVFVVVLGNSVRVLEEDLEVKGRFGWVNGLNRKRGLNSKCTTLKARRLRMVVLCKIMRLEKLSKN